MKQFSALPVIRPLIALAHSRRFIVAVLSALLILVSMQRPEFAPYIGQILLISVSLIFGLSAEDAAKAIANAPKTLAAAEAEAINSAVVSIVPPTIATAVPAITPELIEAIADKVLAAIVKKPLDPPSPKEG